MCGAFVSLKCLGYGNIAPVTDLGKIATIFYAIIGMPLFLLYLSNIGNLSPRSSARRAAAREGNKNETF